MIYNAGIYPNEGPHNFSEHSGTTEHLCLSIERKAFDSVIAISVVTPKFCFDLMTSSLDADEE